MNEKLSKYLGLFRNIFIQLGFLVGFGLLYYPMAHNGKVEFSLYTLYLICFFLFLDYLFNKVFKSKKVIITLHLLVSIVLIILGVASFITYENWSAPINFHLIKDFIASFDFYFQYLEINGKLIVIILGVLSYIPFYLWYASRFYRIIEFREYPIKFSLSVVLSGIVLFAFLPYNATRTFLMNHPQLYSIVDFVEAQSIKSKTKQSEKTNEPLIGSIKPKSQKPDILLFTIDALRRDYFYPYENFNSICPELAVYFSKSNTLVSNNFHSISTYSSCGLSTILSGKEVSDDEIIDISIFQVLKGLSYLTGAILSGNHSGFNNLKYKYGNYIDHYMDGFYDFNSVPTDDRIILKGLNRIDWNIEQPIFMWFHLMSVHSAGLKYKKPKIPLSIEDKIERYNQEYILGLEQACEVISNILSHIEEARGIDSTTIIFTSDHGELLGEGGELAHSRHLKKETLAIPLVIINPNEINIDFGTQMDIAPIILSLVSNDEIAKWEGFYRKEDRPQREVINVHSKAGSGFGKIIKNGGEVIYEIE